MLTLTGGLSKDGKDVLCDGTSSETGVGASIEVSGTKPTIDVHKESWHFDSNFDSNTGNTKHSQYTYNISTKETALGQVLGDVNFGLDDKKSITMNSSGYSTQTSSQLHSTTFETKKSIVLSDNINVSSSMTEDLKTVIDELRGKVPGESVSATYNIESKKLSSQSSWSESVTSYQTHDSLRKLEAELSALLSPETSNEFSGLDTNRKDTDLTFKTEIGIDPSKKLPLPDVHEYSTSNSPGLPDLLKGNYSGNARVNGHSPSLSSESSSPDLNLKHHHITSTPKVNIGMVADTRQTKINNDIRTDNELDVSFKTPHIDFKGGADKNYGNQNISINSEAPKISGGAAVNTQNIDPKLNIPAVDSEGHIIDIDGPSSEMKLKSHKPQKAKVNLTSCFGKPKTNDIDFSAENESISVDSDIKSEGEANKLKGKSKSPQLQGDVTVNSEDRSIVKPKSKMGSCFGKPKENKLEGEYHLNVGVDTDQPATYTPKTDTDFKIDTKIPKAEGNLRANAPSSEAVVSVDSSDLDIKTDSGDASVAVKSPDVDLKSSKLQEKPKSKGTSCFGKPKGTDIDGEYKATTKVKGNIPEGDDLKVEVPRGDASVTVEAPELDIKMAKTSEKPKSKGTSCFGKPKGADIDGEYKGDTSVKIDTPKEKSVKVEVPKGEAS